LKRAQSASGKLRVLAVVPGNDRGSSFVFARRQIASLVNIGFDVRTFYLLSRTSPLVLIKEWRRIRREIRQFRPHLLHAHYGAMTSFFCAVCSTVPLVITFRGSDINGDPDVGYTRSRVAQLLSQISCLRSERIICVSHRLRSRLWWRRSRAVVIPTGVDLRLFHPEPKDQSRSLLGWNQDALIVVFYGAHRPRTKGLPFVQSVVDVAQKVIGPIQLMTLDGNLSPELVPWWLNAADCLAVASLSEGSPNIVKEALACNLPVVATDVGDVSERLKKVQPSKVVPRDVFEFGNALIEILVDRRASNGREQLASLSEERVAEALGCVYERAVKHSSSGTMIRARSKAQIAG
jgi:glycosyltransferase involved in cell wall biosynthesis